jgi:hypothetical protein
MQMSTHMRPIDSIALLAQNLRALADDVAGDKPLPEEMAALIARLAAEQRRSGGRTSR